MRRSTDRNRGFSLLEMMISMALGTIVLAAAVQMYSQGVKATWTVSQRAEMQQDFRAAANMLTKDISLAGASMGNNVQIALPSGNGIQPAIYGCDQTPKCYINGGAVAYPTQLVGGVNVPYLYGLIPGNNFGPVLNAAAGATDIITVVNADTDLLLSCYSVSVTTATRVQFKLDADHTKWPCQTPLLNPQKLNDGVVGLTPGDLIRFNLTIGAGVGATGATVIGEVTNVIDLGSDTYNIRFNAGDPLNMNQPAAAGGSLGNVVGGTGSATRINVITYYIDNSITPPRLMRQVSGHTPIPVAEGVAFLQFTYDLYDFTTGTMQTNQADGGKSLGMTPSQITKINIVHMSVYSTMHGEKGYQGLDLQTSVSARDLTFKNDYPLTTN